MISPKALVKAAVRRYRPQLLYPVPVSSLQPERLYAYLDALWRTRDVPGDVVEVGCWLGGSAAIASRMLRRLSIQKRYVAIDTFSGFVTDQFDSDLASGVPLEYRGIYDTNSPKNVRRLLDHYGAPNVEVVQGDIVTLPVGRLPSMLSVGLIDVDLSVPVYCALSKLYPLLAPGGVILVDDCPEKTTWVGARLSYQRFSREHGLSEHYEFGMGIISV